MTCLLLDFGSLITPLCHQVSWIRDGRLHADQGRINRCGVPSSNLTESLTGFLSGPCSPTKKRSLQTRSSNEDRLNWYQSFSFFLLDLSIFHFSFSDFSFFVLVSFLNLFIVLEPLLNFKCVYVSLFASSVEKKRRKVRPIQKKLPTISKKKLE